jgi:tetratricopeptide (TPR) repeat protein
MRAFKRGDLPAARNLLGRAIALLPPDDHESLAMQSELAIAIWAGGDALAALALLDEAAARAGAAGDTAAGQRATLEATHIRIHADEARPEEALATAEDAIRTFELLNDDRGLARAFHVVGFVQGGFLCRNADWQAAAERSTEHYRRSGWPIATPATSLAGALYYGPAPAAAALERYRALRTDPGLGRNGVADVATFEAGLLAFGGAFEEARAMLDDAVAIKVELGQTLWLAMGSDQIRGYVEVLAGDLDAAERALRTSCQTCERLQAWAHLATQAAELGEILIEQGRFDEAEVWVRVAEEHAKANDLGAQFSWRSVRARILVERGDPERAIETARAAESIVLRTDALNQHGKVLGQLAHVLRASGRGDEADDALARAVAAYERKGNPIAAAAARKAHKGPFASV